MFVSFEYDIASGAAIVLLGTAIFLVVYLGTGVWRHFQPVGAPRVAGATVTAPQGRKAEAQPDPVFNTVEADPRSPSRA